jgi:tetratricopeptide (TPR) repeat protein
VFKKVIGKVCINPDCPQKDKVREESTVLCDCGQELQDQTITDKRKVAIFSSILILILIGGGYFGVMKLKGIAEDTGKGIIGTLLSSIFGGGSVTPPPPPPPGPGEQKPPPPDPKAAMILVSDGLNLVKENKFQEAIDKFRQATSKDQNNDQAWGNLGAAYLAMGKAAEALEATSKAAKLKPAKDVWHLNLAEIYSIKGDKDSALAEFEAAIANGFKDTAKLKSFDFKNIKNEPKFKELAARMR